MMKNGANPGATGVLALACLLLLGGSVLAGDGDYDFDFDVDADDFAYWGSCMTVPDSGDVDPFSPCAAFDFDNDNDVDNYDFGAFQAAYQKPVPPCKPIDKNDSTKKAYVGATIAGHNIRGASAIIDTETVVLCGEPTSTKKANSYAWAGVEHRVPIVPPPVQPPGQPPKPTYTIDKWFQIGYSRQRFAGQTQIHWVKYTEVKFGPQPVWVKFYTIVPGGSHTYKCWKTTLADGDIHFEIDGVGVESYTGPGWDSVSGNFGIAYMGEIQNKDDQMPGTFADPCHFNSCRYRWIPTGSYPDGWRDANISNAQFPNGHLYTVDAQQWQVEWDAPDHIHVWDVIP